MSNRDNKAWNENLYNDLKSAGCQIANHESDLYVKVDENSTRIIKASGHIFSTFRNNIDKLPWYDVPFAYQPWWDARVPKAC